MTRKRWLILLAAIGFALVSWKFYPELWGAGTWGAGGNMVAWVLCGYFAFSWQHAKAEARHRQQADQDEARHHELLAQNERHHREMKDHVSRHLKKGSGNAQGD